MRNNDDSKSPASNDDARAYVDAWRKSVDLSDAWRKSAESSEAWRKSVESSGAPDSALSEIHEELGDDYWERETERCRLDDLRNNADSILARDCAIWYLRGEILEMREQRALILTAAHASINDAWEHGWEAGYDRADGVAPPDRTLEVVLEAFDKSVNSKTT